MSISIFCEGKFFTTIFFEFSIFMYGILNLSFHLLFSFPKLIDLNFPSVHLPPDLILAFPLKMKLYHEFNIRDQKITLLRNTHISVIKKYYPFVPLFTQLRISLDLPSGLVVLLDSKMYSSSQHLKDLDNDNYLVVRHSQKVKISLRMEFQKMFKHSFLFLTFECSGSD